MGDQIELSTEDIVKNDLNKAKYGWSKWGGSNRGLVQEDITLEWACQACGEIQTSELPPFMYEYSEREFIRICSKCQNTRLQKAIEPLQLAVLILIVRRKHSVIDNLPD